ncbi:hypothetical protein OIPHN330_58840 (plasmid) [Citrobacter freundii]|nr:hypothetical protein TMSI_54290 [Klebsiella quasipneumoniae]BEJ31231.1 hypothetical protein OIPH1902010_46670 [Escherichia coli]BEJ37264.1 hypothetical protein OIPHN330_58840 [Citrobacter freundii]BEJ43224.1 hypothetical protein OIPHN354_59360 [Citrobacter freundii]
MKSTKLSGRFGQTLALTAVTSLLACAVQAQTQTLGSNLALTGPSAGADGSGFSRSCCIRGMRWSI